LDNWDFSLT